jgi:putative endonuclease
MKGYMYILLCDNDCYYTGSTIDLQRRLTEHQQGRGANYTKNHPPVKLVYLEEYERIDQAFKREKQIQGWSHDKKKALVMGKKEKLLELSRNYTQFKKNIVSSNFLESVTSTAF